MSWEHKTAPFIITSAEVGEKAIRELHRSSRRGVHAQLPFSVRENPSTLASRPPEGTTAEFDTIRTEAGVRAPAARVTNVIPAKCHPERPAVTALSKLCVECSVQWYLQRIPKGRR
jgi:hypothetical protein